MEIPMSISWRRLFLFLVILAAAAALLMFRDEVLNLWAYATADQSPPVVFAGALILLPALGFPLTPLLILLGGRFGWPGGLAALALVVPVHLVAAFWMSRKFLYHRLSALAVQQEIDLSSLPRAGRIKAGLLFMAFPGLSYALKNHLLPLSGLPAGHCLAIAWPIQVTLGIPFVLFGSAASDWSFSLMAGALVVMVLLMIASRPAARIFRRHNSRPSGSHTKEKTHDA